MFKRTVDPFLSKRTREFEAMSFFWHNNHSRPQRSQIPAAELDCKVSELYTILKAGSQSVSRNSRQLPQRFEASGTCGVLILLVLAEVMTVSANSLSMSTFQLSSSCRKCKQIYQDRRSGGCLRSIRSLVKSIAFESKPPFSNLQSVA